MKLPKVVLPKKLSAKKLTWPLVGLLAIAGLAYLFSKGFIVAALVNGRPVTRYALDTELEKRNGKTALQALVERSLIKQEAQKEGIKIADDEVNAEIAKIEESLKAQNMDLSAALAAQGMTKEELIEQIRIQKSVEKILAGKTTVTDKDIEDYFTKNKSQFPKDTKIETVKPQITQQLSQEKLNTEYQKWIADLTAKAKINYFLKF